MKVTLILGSLQGLAVPSCDGHDNLVDPCGLFHDDQVDQYDSYPDPGFSTGAGSSNCDGHDNLVDPCGLFHNDQVDQYDSYPTGNEKLNCMHARYKGEEPAKETYPLQ